MMELKLIQSSEKGPSLITLVTVQQSHNIKLYLINNHANSSVHDIRLNKMLPKNEIKKGII